MVFFANLCPNREFSARLAATMFLREVSQAPEAGRPSDSVTIVRLRAAPCILLRLAPCQTLMPSTHYSRYCFVLIHVAFIWLMTAVHYNI